MVNNPNSYQNKKNYARVKIEFWQKIQILVKNQNFGQISKLWPKIKIVFNRNSD